MRSKQVLEADILMFDVGLAAKELVFGEFEHGDVDGVEPIHKGDRFGAFLDSRDGAEGDDFVV